jgi:hypothetical protein
MRQLLEQADAVLIDGVEVPCVRPQQDEPQRAHYSGKKKHHSVKSLVISDTDKRILFISPPVPGAIHDYRLMTALFPPEQDWFHAMPLWLDLGFLGAAKDYGPTTQGNRIKQSLECLAISAYRHRHWRPPGGES